MGRTLWSCIKSRSTRFPTHSYSEDGWWGLLICTSLCAWQEIRSTKLAVSTIYVVHVGFSMYHLSESLPEGVDYQMPTSSLGCMFIAPVEPLGGLGKDRSL
jgi:hypothetical protein